MTWPLARLRTEAGQLSWFLRDQLPAATRAKRRAARLGLNLPVLPRGSRQPGQVWGVTMVRDEQDVIADSLTHLLAQGLDHLLVADNLSVDDTPQILAELARRDTRIHVAHDSEPAYYQAEKMTRLALAATHAGADWIVPFDADEFWFADSRSVAEHLRAQGRLEPLVGVVTATWHHMLPTQPAPMPLREREFVIDSAATVPGKVAMRAHRWGTLHVGNHFAQRVGERTGGLHIAHAVFRDPAQVARKVRQGSAAVMLTNPGNEIAPYWRAGAQISDQELASLWSHLIAGGAEPRLGLHDNGPKVRARPLCWDTWDPEHLLARA